MFFEYLDRMITVYEGTGRKKMKIQLVDKPEIIQPQCILQPTLQDAIPQPQQSDTKIDIILNSDKIKNSILNEYIKQENELKNKYNIFINKMKNINNNIVYNNIQ